MTSVVACVYKHPVKTKHVFQYSFRASYFCLALVSWPFSEIKQTEREKKKSRQSRVKKRWGSKNFPKKRHLPETPSPEESYSPIKVSVTESLPPMTRRNSATSTKPAEFKRDEQLQHIELCNFCYIFISFPDFSSTFHWFDIFDPYLPRV